MLKFDLSTALNKEQCEAASVTDGPLLVIAGAGSGKTRMLTYRIAHMLESGIDEKNILALTFTNKAAREMGQRIRQLTELPLKKLTTTTFHSFGMGVLKQYIQHLGYKNNFTIYDTNDKLALLHELVLENDDDPDKYDFYEVAQLFSDVKTGRTQFHEQSKMSKMYDEYLKYLKAYNAVDFDDLITLPLVLFEKRPDVLEALRERYRYILVDEFQDTSLCQYKMVASLAKKSHNICVVGDDDQSIYSWRGANYENLLMFEHDFPERKEIKLEENYRSSGTILEAANDLIVHNKQRKKKKLWTNGERGSTIRIIHPTDGNWEARNIADMIVSEMGKEPLTYDDFAILVRTNRLMAPIAEELETRNIPLNVTGGPNLLDRKEVRDILSYLKCIVNTDDDVNFRRIINTPTRGIGRTTLEKIQKVADNFDCPLFDAARRISQTEDKSVSDAIKRTLDRFCNMIEDYSYRFENAQPGNKNQILHLLVNEIGYQDYLQSQHPANTKQTEWQMKGIDIFCRKLSYFEMKHKGSSIAQFLTVISLDTNEDDEKDMGKVSLMTMHAAKGLEFHTVFLAAVEEPFVPSGKALEENPANLDEERRLFYVAITRAKRTLVISSCLRRERNGKELECVPSRFLGEMPENLFSEEDPDRQLSSNEVSDKLASLKEFLASKRKQ